MHNNTWRTFGKPVVATTMLAGCLIAANAHAVTYSAGTLNTTPYINTPTVIGAFSDIYDFSVATLPGVAGASVAVNLDLGDLSFHISGLSLNLYTAGNTLLASDTVTGPADVSVSVNDTLTTGNYYFIVQGTADGIATNAGIYTFTAAAVPEADSYAMMLAGLGLVAYTISRRKNDLN